MSEYLTIYSWCDYFVNPSTWPNLQLFILIVLDCVSWLHLNTSYVLGNKTERSTSKPSFADRGNPQFFYEVVQNWVAFELVKVFHKYGLNPLFQSNIKEWSTDLHCVVEFLKKISQKDDDRKRAQECIDILFDPKKPNTIHLSYVVNMEQKGTLNTCPTSPFHWLL